MKKIPSSDAQLPFPDDIDQLEMATLLFAAALDFFDACGLPRADAVKAFAAAQKNRSPTPFPSDKTVMAIGACIRHWHTSEAYTNDSGAPRPLPRTGKKSLTSLIQECGLRNTEDVVLAGLRLGSITKHGSRYLPKLRGFRVPKRGTLTMWYGAQAAQRALQAMTQNIRRGSATPTLFHRAAHQLAMGKKHVPLFKKFVSEQGSDFIEMLDDWMGQRGATDGAAESIPVSVHAFAWIDDSHAGHSSPRLTGQKRSKVLKPKSRNA